MRSLTFVLLLLTACGARTPAPPIASTTAPPLIRFDAPWTSPYRVDPHHPYHLVNAEGQRLFLLNKTAWHYFSARDPQAILRRTRALGANVIRVALEGKLYFDHLGIDAWPWGGTRKQPRFDSFNEEYWKRVEERIELAGRAGIGLDLVLYASLKPRVGDAELQRRYWDRVLSRLGRYANVLLWEIQNEHVENEAFQDLAGEYLSRHDVHRRPVITSDGTTDAPIWPHKPWMGMAIVHTCTSSTPKHSLRGWYLPIARNTRAHGKPAFNNETGREKRHRNDDGVHRRKQAWVWTAAGAFWTWHSWDGCEGIDDPLYRAPGEEFIPSVARFWQELPFWRLSPDQTTLSPNAQADLVTAVLADAGRDLVVAYLATEETGRSVAPTTAELRLPDGEYRIELLAPSDLRLIATTTMTSRGRGTPATLELPGFADDLLVRVTRTQRRRTTEIEGTR